MDDKTAKNIYLVSIGNKVATFCNDSLILDNSGQPHAEALAFANNISENFNVNIIKVDLSKHKDFQGDFSWQDVGQYIRKELIKLIVPLDIEPGILTQKNPTESNNDYVLDPDDGGAWIEVGDLCVYISNNGKDLIVKIFCTGYEADNELDSMSVSFDYAASLIEQKELERLLEDKEDAEFEHDIGL